MKSIFGTRPESSTAGRARSRTGFGMSWGFLICALILWSPMGCGKKEAVPEPVKAPQVQLPPDIAREIVGRWRIFWDDGCGIAGMSDEEVERYMGKIAVIEPGRMVMIDHVGDELVCRFTNVKVSVRDTVEYLAERTGCGPGNPVFDSFVRKVKSKKVKHFEPEPYCGGSPFFKLFMPNAQTMVVQWNGVFFFMNRADSGGEAGGTKRGS